jgi:uncharacterized membrane protein YeiB
MSEAHPDADLVKVTRTITTYEPAAKTGPVAIRRRNRTLIWVAVVVVAVAVVAGGLIWLDLSSAPAAAPHSAVAADQTSALSQQATAAQQSADQSATQTNALAATAAQDRTAARHAAAIANASGKSL